MKHFKPENDVKMEGRRLNFLEILNNLSIRNDYDRILNKKILRMSCIFGRSVVRYCTEHARNYAIDLQQQRVQIGKRKMCGIHGYFLIKICYVRLPWTSEGTLIRNVLQSVINYDDFGALLIPILNNKFYTQSCSERQKHCSAGIGSPLRKDDVQNFCRMQARFPQDYPVGGYVCGTMTAHFAVGEAQKAAQSCFFCATEKSIF